MNYQHKELAAGRWRELTIVEQMANIGSEVERALTWRRKKNEAYCQKALDRAFELIDLTIDGQKTFARLKEIARLREAIADYFFGENQFQLTDASLSKYFLKFVYASRRNI